MSWMSVYLCSGKIYDIMECMYVIIECSCCIITAACLLINVLYSILMYSLRFYLHAVLALP